MPKWVVEHTEWTEPVLAKGLMEVFPVSHSVTERTRGDEANARATFGQKTTKVLAPGVKSFTSMHLCFHGEEPRGWKGCKKEGQSRFQKVRRG